MQISAIYYYYYHNYCCYYSRYLFFYWFIWCEGVDLSVLFDCSFFTLYIHFVLRSRMSLYIYAFVALLVCPFRHIWMCMCMWRSKVRWPFVICKWSPCFVLFSCMLFVFLVFILIFLPCLSRVGTEWEWTEQWKQIQHIMVIGVILCVRTCVNTTKRNGKLNRKC